MNAPIPTRLDMQSREARPRSLRLRQHRAILQMLLVLTLNVQAVTLQSCSSLSTDTIQARRRTATFTSLDGRDLLRSEGLIGPLPLESDEAVMRGASVDDAIAFCIASSVSTSRAIDASPPVSEASVYGGVEIQESLVVLLHPDRWGRDVSPSEGQTPLAVQFLVESSDAGFLAKWVRVEGGRSDSASIDVCVTVISSSFDTIAFYFRLRPERAQWIVDFCGLNAI